MPGGVQMPRTNAIMQRSIPSCRRELLDRTLVCNRPHVLHTLHKYESHDNLHRPTEGFRTPDPWARPPDPITDPGQLTRLDIRRRDHLSGIIHEYEQAA